MIRKYYDFEKLEPQRGWLLSVRDSCTPTDSEFLVWSPVQKSSPVTDDIEIGDLSYFAMEKMLAGNWEDSFCVIEHGPCQNLPVQCDSYTNHLEMIASADKRKEELMSKFAEVVEERLQEHGQYKFLNRGTGMTLLREYKFLLSEMSVIPSIIR